MVYFSYLNRDGWFRFYFVSASQKYSATFDYCRALSEFYDAGVKFVSK